MRHFRVVAVRTRYALVNVHTGRKLRVGNNFLTPDDATRFGEAMEEAFSEEVVLSERYLTIVGDKPYLSKALIQKIRVEAAKKTAKRRSILLRQKFKQGLRWDGQS